jgi:hypothetical protein
MKVEDKVFANWITLRNLFEPQKKQKGSKDYIQYLLYSFVTFVVPSFF